MSLIRDKDRCCPIMGIFTFVSFLSFCYHRSILVLHACSSMLCAFCESCCSASPLRGRGPVCSEYLCVRTLLYEPISRRSLRLEQSCKLAVSREEETTYNRQMTKPKRRLWTTKSGGCNTLKRCTTSLNEHRCTTSRHKHRLPSCNLPDLCGAVHPVRGGCGQLCCYPV